MYPSYPNYPQYQNYPNYTTYATSPAFKPSQTLPVASMSPVHFMGVLMSKQQLDMPITMELVDALNKSYFNCQNVVTIMEDIFANEKSSKILLAVQILEILIKNCNRNWHQAANRNTFQQKLLGLLKRQRGKSSFLKSLTSNTQNLAKIECKLLYLIQLWYDAFILEEGVFPNIINTYKILRKENVVFPPRLPNERNLLAVQTQSPILENIEQFAEHDRKKFEKRLNNMGMKNLSDKFVEVIKENQQKKKESRLINVDEISERIAIIRSNEYQGEDIIRIIQSIKEDVRIGRVEPKQQEYWKQIKIAAEGMIKEWEQANEQLVKEEQKRFFEKKMNMMGGMRKEKGQEKEEEKNENQKKPQIEEDQFGEFSDGSPTKNKIPQTNLLDLI